MDSYARLDSHAFDSNGHEQESVLFGERTRCFLRKCRFGPAESRLPMADRWQLAKVTGDGVWQLLMCHDTSCQVCDSLQGCVGFSAEEKSGGCESAISRVQNRERARSRGTANSPSATSDPGAVRYHRRHSPSSVGVAASPPRLPGQRYWRMSRTAGTEARNSACWTCAAPVGRGGECQTNGTWPG